MLILKVPASGTLVSLVYVILQCGVNGTANPVYLMLYKSINHTYMHIVLTSLGVF